MRTSEKGAITLRGIAGILLILFGLIGGGENLLKAFQGAWVNPASVISTLVVMVLLIGGGIALIRGTKTIQKTTAQPSQRSKIGLRKRNDMDKWPLIVEKRMENPDKENTVTYTLTETSLGNPTSIQATTTQHCVYCENFSDPEFRDPAFPEGGGYCKSWNGSIGFKDSCKDWRPNVRVKYWFSKGYMRAKGRAVRYQLIDDGPVGEKGAS